jgi:hypothetical protein
MPSYEDVTLRAGSLRAMTGLTEQEFQALLPHFEQAFVAYMHDHTLDGQPRTVRRYTLTHDCRQTALYSDIFETESSPRSPRTTLWDVPIEC